MVDLVNNFWFLLFAMITLTSVAGTLASAWRKVRRDEQEAALKQEMLRREMSVEEMARVLGLGTKSSREEDKPGSEESYIEDMAAHLAGCEASTSTIEEVLTAVRAADPASRKAIARSVQAIVDNHGEATEAQILGVVRGLTRPVPAGKCAATPPASATIQLPPELQPIEPV
jgi:hypothetical protein